MWTFLYQLTFVFLFSDLAFGDASCGVDTKQEAATRPNHIIVARGSGEPEGVGSLGQVVDRMKTIAMNADVEAVNYPATTEYSRYESSVATGATELHGMIDKAIATGEERKIVLLGYSQGANVVMDTVCALEESRHHLIDRYRKHLKAIVLMGDPTHNSHQRFIKGTGGSQNGIIPREKNIDCHPFTDRIMSYCDIGDAVCSSGGDPAVHGSYPSTYANNAAWFALAGLWK